MDLLQKLQRCRILTTHRCSDIATCSGLLLCCNVRGLIWHDHPEWYLTASGFLYMLLMTSLEGCELETEVECLGGWSVVVRGDRHET